MHHKALNICWYIWLMSWWDGFLRTRNNKRFPHWASHTQVMGGGWRDIESNHLHSNRWQHLCAYKYSTARTLMGFSTGPCVRESDMKYKEKRTKGRDKTFNKMPLMNDEDKEDNRNLGVSNRRLLELGGFHQNSHFCWWPQLLSCCLLLLFRLRKESYLGFVCFMES